MRSGDGEGRSIRSDALYPAGEREVPVTRNAKITPVNEGGGGRGRGEQRRERLWNEPQGSELGVQTPDGVPPSPSPIRRIIDHGFAPTGAPAFNGWGLLLMLSV